MIKQRGLEAGLLEQAPSDSIEAAIVKTTSKYLIDHERKIIEKVFLKEQQLRFTNLVRFIPDRDYGLGIITTNYDRLVELACEEANLDVDNGFDGSSFRRANIYTNKHKFTKTIEGTGGATRTKLTDHAVVLKPHGSLDWLERAGMPVSWASDLPNAKRLIIPPGGNKFRNGYRQPFDRHRESANKRIGGATAFLIIGYGFNDEHLETYLTPALRRGVPTVLMTRSLSENARKVVQESSNVIALESHRRAEIEGTGYWAKGTMTFLPGMRIWDLGEFVREVLGG